jgi:hypothetical protein
LNSPGKTEHPLVTFALFAYNQEDFIREAVVGALAQTYEPLEIILSDDCSADRTFEIMQEIAAQYDGPHRVLLNRSGSNRGLGGHINEVVKLAQGELLVFAAGDDVSYPQRTTVLVEHWLARRRPLAICSSWDYIRDGSNYAGSPDWFLESARRFPDESRYSALASFVSTGRYCIVGCSAAYSANLFKYVGPLPQHLRVEDMVLTFRALLLQTIAFLEIPLVGYRTHGANIWAAAPSRINGPAYYVHFALDLARRAALQVEVREAHLSDLRVIEMEEPAKGVERLELQQTIEESLEACELLARWSSLSSWRRVRALRRVRCLPFAGSLKGWRGFIFCLPVPIFSNLSYTLHWIRHIGSRVIRQAKAANW